MKSSHFPIKRESSQWPCSLPRAWCLWRRLTWPRRAGTCCQWRWYAGTQSHTSWLGAQSGTLQQWYSGWLAIMSWSWSILMISYKIWSILIKLFRVTTVRWQFDLVNEKESILSIWNKPYQKNKNVEEVGGEWHFPEQCFEKKASEIHKVKNCKLELWNIKF